MAKPAKQVSYPFSIIEDNVLINEGIAIGKSSIIMSNSLVEDNVPDNAVVSGNPAAVIGFTRTDFIENSYQLITEVCLSNLFHDGLDVARLPVSNCYAYRFKQFSDERGSLFPLEFSSLPFAPRRSFMVSGVPANSSRGLHAHKACSQFIFCTTGSVKILIDDGINRQVYILDNSNIGIYCPPLIWGCQFCYSQDAILHVYASHIYEKKDYISSYDEFLEYSCMFQRNPSSNVI